jgi:hypothetical protein
VFHGQDRVDVCVDARGRMTGGGRGLYLVWSG